MRGNILNKIKDLGNDFLLFIIIIISMLIIPDFSFGHLSKMEGMSIRLMLILAYAYSIFASVSIMGLIIIYNSKHEKSLLRAFLMGLVPFVVAVTIIVIKEAIGDISFDHKIYLDNYLSRVGYFVSLGFSYGLMGVSTQVYKSDKSLGLLMFITSICLWIILYLLPLIRVATGYL
ncbi:MAG: hypothetical protein ACP5M7_03655 [Thermoproteota archaeon]